jgi:hypothetical protein
MRDNQKLIELIAGMIGEEIVVVVGGILEDLMDFGYLSEGEAGLIGAPIPRTDIQKKDGERREAERKEQVEQLAARLLIAVDEATSGAEVTYAETVRREAAERLEVEQGHRDRADLIGARYEPFSPPLETEELQGLVESLKKPAETSSDDDDDDHWLCRSYPAAW